ncbi:acyl carrier protein [Streptomyces antimycoticus]|uniref:acyl carrier protein n=1 Tax=Streptomyces antimycoticus TaxID=68175 RepID=UPI00367A382E
MRLDSIDECLEVIVRSHCPELQPGTPISPDDNLSNFGLNSVSTISILVDVEEAFGVAFSDEDLSFETFQTLRRLRQTIAKYLGEPADR